MGLAMQLPIINLGYTEYLPFKGEALAPGQIIQPLLHRRDSRGFYFFPPASLWFLTTYCLADVYFQLKYTSPRSQSTPGISDVCGL